MNAQIIDLSAALSRAQQVAGCHRCSTIEGRCGPHQVVEVVERLREHRSDAEAELLVNAADIVAVLTEAVNALEVVVAGALQPHERRVR